jgi:TPR repeat protein
MYKYGQGVTQDNKEAVKWWRLAAEQGYASAQFNLGGMYGEGISVIQNYVIAHMWFNIAASNGYESAKKGIDIVESRMSSEQIAEAQKLARECIKKNYKDCG